MEMLSLKSRLHGGKYEWKEAGSLYLTVVLTSHQVSFVMVAAKT